MGGGPPPVDIGAQRRYARDERPPLQPYDPNNVKNNVKLESQHDPYDPNNVKLESQHDPYGTLRHDRNATLRSLLGGAAPQQPYDPNNVKLEHHGDRTLLSRLGSAAPQNAMPAQRWQRGPTDGQKSMPNLPFMSVTNPAGPQVKPQTNLSPQKPMDPTGRTANADTVMNRGNPATVNTQPQLQPNKMATTGGQAPGGTPYGIPAGAMAGGMQAPAQRAELGGQPAAPKPVPQPAPPIGQAPATARAGSGGK